MRIRPVISDGAKAGLVTRHVVVQGVWLALHDWGNAAAPPLILLHGGRDHGRSWDTVAERLRDRFHVVCPDLRGHGDSDWSIDGRYPMETLVADLAGLIVAEGLGPLTIVAHSLGGNIAIRYSALYPETVTKLVAIEGLGRSPAMIAEREAEPMARRLRRWMDDLRAIDARPSRILADIAEARMRMAEAHPGFAPTLVDHLVRHGVRATDAGQLVWKHDRRILTMSPVDLTTAQQHALWAAIDCPTLLVYGRDSWASSPLKDGRAALMPAAKVAMVEGAGHWVQHDRFEDFMRLLDRFL